MCASIMARSMPDSAYTTRRSVYIDNVSNTGHFIIVSDFQEPYAQIIPHLSR